MISDQPTSNKKYCAGIAAAEWSGKLSGGSDLIRAMQRWAGVTADGYLGPQTIRALQKKLGTPVERYKTAIVFGTVNTVSQSLILISRNYKDQIDIKSLCGASETSITGNVNLETGNVTLNFSGNNSAIIIW